MRESLKNLAHEKTRTRKNMDYRGICARRHCGWDDWGENGNRTGEKMEKQPGKPEVRTKGTFGHIERRYNLAGIAAISLAVLGLIQLMIVAVAVAAYYPGDRVPGQYSVTQNFFSDPGMMLLASVCGVVSALGFDRRCLHDRSSTDHRNNESCDQSEDHCVLWGRLVRLHDLVCHEINGVPV